MDEIKENLTGTSCNFFHDMSLKEALCIFFSSIRFFLFSHFKFLQTLTHFCFAGVLKKLLNISTTRMQMSLDRCEVSEKSNKNSIPSDTDIRTTERIHRMNLNVYKQFLYFFV